MCRAIGIFLKFAENDTRLPIMTPGLFVTVLTFALPMFSALVCCVLVVPRRLHHGGRGDRRVRRMLAAYFFMAGLSWFGMLIYPFFSRLMVLIQSEWYLAILVMQVIFYNFVFNITRLDPARRFPLLHYLIPAVIVGTLFVWSLFVPLEVQSHIMSLREPLLPGYGAYRVLFLSKPTMRLIFSAVYTTLSVVRIVRYRRVVADFSANDEQSSLRWINVVLVLAFGFLIMPLVGVVSGRAAIYSALPSVFTALTVAAQHVILTVNTLRGRYLIPEEAPAAGRGDDRAPARARAPLSAAEFEEYLRSRKPYTDPNLRITDMALGLCSNRTYLSTFINETYGVSFSRLMNRLRMEELDGLRANPAFGGLSTGRLVEMAGFGSYRNYQRAKAAEGE
jgi:AraC-like DNA-binding protein